MITDALLRVSDAQAVTATAVSTNSVDLGAQARDVGAGCPLYALFTTSVAATAAGAATVTFEVIVADDAALTTNVTVIGSSNAEPKASLPIGAQIPVRLNPQIGSTGRRYLGVRYTVATGPLTAGTFTVDFVESIEDIKSYDSGF
jgi:hypothetical protein